ncbi:TOBE domain-containing protein, partial [Dickeya dianthicola]
APAEIYRQPASLFVASFIGSPAMNLWAGQVSADGSCVELSADFSLPLPLAKPQWQGRTVTLGMRPEHILQSSADAGGVPLVVETLELLGADNLAHGTWAGQNIVVRLSHEHCPAVGETLWLTLPAASWHIFDSQSGLRMEA